MEKLRQNILKKYNDDVKKFIKDELSKKGFIKADNGVILKLDVFNNDFEAIGFDIIDGVVNRNVPDLWNIPSEIKSDIIYQHMMESLPYATESEIKNYLTYYGTEKAMIDDKRLKSNVDALLKANKKNHKKVYQGGYKAPEYQSQALINADVVYDENIKDYFIFDKNNDMFKKLSKSDIWNILNNEFDKFNKSEIDLLDISDNMKVQYFMFISNSSLPHIYNQNKANKDIFIDLKDDYQKVKKIISKFD